MITAAAPTKLSHNEVLKENSPTLSGTLASTLANAEVDRFSEDDGQFLKFHGIYQQDDRDKRKVAKYYMFMIRTRFPGGVIPPAQYLVLDRLADTYGNQTLRATTRQTIQFHGVVKTGLGKLMKTLNENLMTTIAACGDVSRNVMAPPTPATSPFVEEVLEDARHISTTLLPKTPAYHQIWVEGTQLDLGNEAKDFVDPLYGKTYLPRKFKAVMGIPPLNDVDLFTNCLGYIAIIESGKLVGYNLTVGGGMGVSHGNAQTFPRLADVIGFVTREQLETVSKGVLTIHRDFGDRTNRKHARLKYVLEDKGAEWFKAELENRIGFKLPPARDYKFTKQGDLFGWHSQVDGKEFLGLYVEAGRIKDTATVKFKAAVREIVEKYQIEVRLTPSQNILLANVAVELKQPITEILARHGIDVGNQGTIVRRAMMACPAMPTCGLALAESERYLPDLVGRIEQLMEEVGLGGEEIIIRMTGCPNGCARPFMAELGFVGKAPNKYQIYFGGNESSTRLNKMYKDSVPAATIIDELRPVFTRFVAERTQGERFGDFCARVIWNDPVPAKN
ncbi:MAG: nitrite and sulphite reductase 4Fe-4S region [Verrucomicrobiales bacterium]|nr:nitrite and sulphite reductase 4Fe-4S region [Verrucomicrobiales bacterium]